MSAMPITADDLTRIDIRLTPASPSPRVKTRIDLRRVVRPDASRPSHVRLVDRSRPFACHLDNLGGATWQLTSRGIAVVVCLIAAVFGLAAFTVVWQFLAVSNLPF